MTRENIETAIVFGLTCIACAIVAPRLAAWLALELGL
jgi:hypothetical protein